MIIKIKRKISDNAAMPTMNRPSPCRLWAGLCMMVLVACMQNIFGDETLQLESYPKEKVHLFLLAGQSNMAGRGKVTAEDKKIHPRVFALSKDGAWVPAIDPIHYDKKSAGVGLGKSFAVTLADRNADIVIGLVPAACGGSPISTWQPGGYHAQTQSHPYDDAIERTQRAMKDGVLKGILWHQGESDSNPGKAPHYKERLTQLIDRFRKDLDAENVPFIIGQLGQFPAKPWNTSRKRVNEAQISIAEEMPLVGFVSSDGLTSKSDNIHFDTPSQREFGRRYAAKYLEMLDCHPGATAVSNARFRIDRSWDIAEVPSGFPVRFCLLTSGNHQYVAYYDEQRRMTVASRTLGSEQWRYQALPSEVGWDSHNYITMAMDGEGHLHVSGNMHVDPLLYFRTEKPEDISTLKQFSMTAGIQLS